MAEIFPLLYVVLALPAGRLLDAGFRPALPGGAGLVALGGVLRLGGQNIERLLIVEAILALAAAAILIWELRAPAPNEGAGEERAAVEGRAVRALWAKAQMRNMAGLVFVGFVALTTWLQTLLAPAGVSEGAAGALLVGMLVFGMVGCAILPPLVDRRGAERAFMRAAALTAIIGPTLLGLAIPTPARAVVLAAMGFVLLPALPIILTAAERPPAPPKPPPPARSSGSPAA